MPGTFLLISFSQLPAGEWRWKIFTPHKAVCRHSGGLLYKPTFIDGLPQTRSVWGKPVSTTFRHCSPAHSVPVESAAASRRSHSAFFSDYPCMGQNVCSNAAKAAPCTGVRQHDSRNGMHSNRGFRRPGEDDKTVLFQCYLRALEQYAAGSGVPLLSPALFFPHGEYSSCRSTSFFSRQ